MSQSKYSFFAVFLSICLTFDVPSPELIFFRQSLSKAELDRMFEDDSTGSFEKLEMRLKTPKRPLTKPNLVSKVPQPVKFDKTEQKSTTVQKKEEEIIEHQDPSTELLRVSVSFLNSQTKKKPSNQQSN